MKLPKASRKKREKCHSFYVRHEVDIELRKEKDFQDKKRTGRMMKDSKNVSTHML